jgi:opacity protein-like surface antigen
MNKLIQIALSLVTVLAIPTLRAGDMIIPAKAPLQEAASEATGYVFAYGGSSLGLSTSSSLLDPGPAIPFGADLDDGLIVGFGTGFYSNLFGGSRFEMEALLSSADYRSLTFAGFDVPILGEMRTQGLFLNILKEFPLGNAMAYAGGGLGIGTVEASFLTLTPGGEGPGDVIAVESKGTGLAYQLKAGIDIPVSDRVAIFGEYKLIGLSDRSSTFLLFQQETDGFVSNHFVVGGRLSF